jgi:hypothetical protein
MASGGYFRYHAAVSLVHIYGAGDYVRKEYLAVFYYGGGGFIAT